MNIDYYNSYAILDIFVRQRSFEKSCQRLYEKLLYFTNHFNGSFRL